ncbi:hypothetical protein SAY86_030202 [Trapa natans]|uniref:Homeobox domain-containing protein n=1 Tax=Trapa natans TaxID=22666 RepID=A0AAN7M2G8_TRANT|nr:hypothetical protein SAY86_030202 [Trapa natans]
MNWLPSFLSCLLKLSVIIPVGCEKTLKAMEEASTSAAQVNELISAVKELQKISSQELNKLLRESENLTVLFQTKNGSTLKVDLEKFVGFLPLHLMAVLMSAEKDQDLFRYILSGLRLLHSLCDLASRNNKIEQILLDDVKLSEQLIDLVIYSLIVLGGFKQELNGPGSMPLLHSVLVASTLHLLTGFISSQWTDLVHVLLAHPKIDIFMDVAFRAVCIVSRSLSMGLSGRHDGFCILSDMMTEQMITYLCQQCEASLQFLHSLCQNKTFRERLLRNKELCGGGGVLVLTRTILKLEIHSSFSGFYNVIAAISRLKARVLSILLHLCEAESISYLDEVASFPGSLDLAKSVVKEVLNLLKTAVCKDYKYSRLHSDWTYPTGLLQLNAMRLADIFSDDSNFRSYITTHFTEVLTAIFSVSHGEFLSCWCSSEPPLREEDATVEYDPYASAGLMLDLTSTLLLPDNERNLEFGIISNNLPQSSYAHQRTSLFVKIIANLHCFIPNICEEQERNLFLHKFLESLQGNVVPGLPHTYDTEKASVVCKNLRSLLSHAESLIPTHLNEEDMQLLRVFFDQLQSSLFEQNGVKFQDSKHGSRGSLEEFASLTINELGTPLNMLRRRVGDPEEKIDKVILNPIAFSRLILLYSFNCFFPTPCFNDINSLKGSSKKTGLLFMRSLMISWFIPPYSSISAQGVKGLSENFIFQDLDYFYIRSKHSVEGEGKTGDSGVGVSREPGKDAQNIDTSGSDCSSMKGKNQVDQMENSDSVKLSKRGKGSRSVGVQEDDKVEMIQTEEKQRRKRKRTIMNDEQIAMIEEALVDEPEMQRNAAMIQSWADKLSSHGSEVTCSQLKNWLNNRKARLARAAKDNRGMNDARDKSESPDSPGMNETYISSSSRGRPRHASRSIIEKHEAAEFSRFEPGQHVAIVDQQGEEVGRGTVVQVRGLWYGKSLDEMSTYVVEITDLKALRWLRLPYASEAIGNSFEEAETKLGTMRVLWDSNKIISRPNK